MVPNRPGKYLLSALLSVHIYVEIEGKGVLSYYFLNYDLSTYLLNSCKIKKNYRPAKFY